MGRGEVVDGKVWVWGGWLEGGVAGVEEMEWQII